MTPRGAAQLITMRMNGQRPSAPIWISVGNFLEPDWHRWNDTCNSPELVIRPGDPIDRLDLRCLKGLSVFLFFNEWSDHAGSLFEKLKEIAHEITVMSPAFEDEIGWFWIKGYGQIDFNKRQHLESLKDAQADCTHAARNENQIAYAAARARELAILEAAPWLL